MPDKYKAKIKRKPKFFSEKYNGGFLRKHSEAAKMSVEGKYPFSVHRYLIEVPIERMSLFVLCRKFNIQLEKKQIMVRIISF